MTLTEFIPGLRDKQPKGDPKHRVDDYIAALKADHEQQLAELREENRALLNAKAGADDFFAIQDDNLKAQDTEIQRLRDRLDESETGRTAAVLTAEAHAVWIGDLERQIAELQERLNTGALAESVVTQTQPIPVVPVPLHQSPQAAVTNPGHVRQASWGVDDTQPPKTVEGVA